MDDAREATRAREFTSRRIARRANAMTGESQWEHHAKFMGELFMGTMALVGAFLTYMYCHLKARRDERRRAASERLLRAEA